jgi:hypothetical protein
MWINVLYYNGWQDKKERKGLRRKRQETTNAVPNERRVETRTKRSFAARTGTTVGAVKQTLDASKAVDARRKTNSIIRTNRTFD